ncbi:hypothetical protein Pa4123_85790 [Phytohabitans aurantiacus]|uniref:Uncharacterized protein n=1 Tax=Phytohabitans aurantiacus TaxID=3016789 RepID=A0ABQ5R959_9ACTN|nr:hypothetical protein Pa4123_85790 [Phytohabitans aurantiacus]
MPAEKRSNRVRLPLIGATGVATRRTGPAWERTHAEIEIQPRAFALDRRAGRGGAGERRAGEGQV